MLPPITVDTRDSLQFIIEHPLRHVGGSSQYVKRLVPVPEPLPLVQTTFPVPMLAVFVVLPTVHVSDVVEPMTVDPHATELRVQVVPAMNPVPPIVAVIGLSY